MAKKGKPQKATRTGYGILNPYGDMWTSHVFERPEQAADYVRDYWKQFPASNTDVSKFKVVKARQSAVYVGDHQ